MEDRALIAEAVWSGLMWWLLSGSLGHGAKRKVAPDFTSCSPACAGSLLSTVLRGTRRPEQVKAAAPSADSV